MGFAAKFFPDSDHMSTLFESCGVADLIAMSFGGRNRLCALNFAQTAERTHRLVRRMNEKAGGDGAFGEASVKGTTSNVEAWASFCFLLWQDVEQEVLGGQFCQGIRTLRDMWPLVQQRRVEAEFPLFRTIWRITGFIEEVAMPKGSPSAFLSRL